MAQPPWIIKNPKFQKNGHSACFNSKGKTHTNIQFYLKLFLRSELCCIEVSCISDRWILRYAQNPSWPKIRNFWGSHEAIDIFDFFTLSSHNFFPERDTDSDKYIRHHFSKSVPRIRISSQIPFWTAHTRHSPPWIIKNPEFQHIEMTTGTPPREWVKETS